MQHTYDRKTAVNDTEDKDVIKETVPMKSYFQSLNIVNNAVKIHSLGTSMNHRG